MAGVITDSLGRRWDPAKHPRDRKGRFIRTFHKVRLFEVGGTKPWGVGTVSDITDADHIGVDVTALARNNPESANHRIGEHVDVKAENLESVNEKASLSQSAKPALSYDEVVRTFAEARGPLDANFERNQPNPEKQEEFVSALRRAGIDPESIDPNAPDALPALQPLIDQQNEDNPLPNGWKEILPETLDREFKFEDSTRRGLILVGSADEADYFESDDDGENWDELDIDNFDDLFDDGEPSGDEEPKATLPDQEQKALPAKPHAEDDFLAALEELWDDDESVLEEGEAQELIPGYGIERPEGSKDSKVYGPNGEEIVSIPQTADNERLQEAASKIFDFQQENLPEDDEEQKAELPPENAPAEPLPEDAAPEPEPEPEPERETTPTEALQAQIDDKINNLEAWQDDNNHSENVNSVLEDIADLEDLTNDEGQTQTLLDRVIQQTDVDDPEDIFQIYEAILARRAEPELEEEREARKIKDAEAEFPDGNDESPVDEGGPLSWDDLSDEDYALVGFDEDWYEKQQGQVPEHVEALEEQGLVEVTRDMISPDEYEEWHATLTPEGADKALDIRHRLGATELIDPEDLTDDEIDQELARLDESDADPNIRTFDKNKNRVRRKMVTMEKNRRSGTDETEPVEEETPESASASRRDRMEEGLPTSDGTGPAYNDDDERRSHIDSFVDEVVNNYESGELSREDADYLLDRLDEENNDFLDKGTMDAYRSRLDGDETQPQNAPDNIEDALVAYDNAEDDDARHDAATEALDLITSLIKDEEGNVTGIRTETRDQYIQRYRDVDFEQSTAKWTSDEDEFPEIGEWLLAPGYNPKDTRLNEYMVDENGEQYRYHQRGVHKGKRIYKGDQVAFKFKTSGKGEIDPATGQTVTREGIWIGTVSRFMGDPQKGGKINIRYVSTDGTVKYAEIDYDNVYDVEGMDTSIVHNKTPEIQAPKGLTRKEEIDHFIDAWIGTDNQRRFSRLDGNEKLMLSDGYYLKARQGGEPPYLSLVAPDGRVVDDYIEVPGYQYGTVSRRVDGPGGNPVHRFENREDFIDGLDDLIGQDQINPKPGPQVDETPEPDNSPTPEPDAPRGRSALREDGAPEPDAQATSGESRDLESFVPDPGDIGPEPLVEYPALDATPEDMKRYAQQMNDHIDWSIKNQIKRWRERALAREDVFAAGPTLKPNNVNTSTAKANKHRQPGHTHNCFNCVTAWVLRMKGYDVQAEPHPSNEPGPNIYQLASRWWGGTSAIQFHEARRSRSIAAWARDLRERLARENGPESYGVITIAHKGSSRKSNGVTHWQGHVFVWYVTPEGEVRFLEPQTGEEYIGDTLWNNVAPSVGSEIVRLDNLPLPTGEGVISNVAAAGGAI